MITTSIQRVCLSLAGAFEVTRDITHTSDATIVAWMEIMHKNSGIDRLNGHLMWLVLVLFLRVDYLFECGNLFRSQFAVADYVAR